MGRPIRYAGNNLDLMQQTMKAFSPGWLAYDMRLMMSRYQKDGAAATTADLARLTALLGHAPSRRRSSRRPATR